MTEDECEYCAQPPGKHRVVECPMPEEAAALAPFFWVVNPLRLVFCDEHCRVKWHGLRRKALWQAHGAGCVCVECMEKA